MKDGFDFIENRFFVRGEGNILYNFNGGRLAKDPKTAAQMFLRTFETISPLLEKYQNDTEKFQRTFPSFRKSSKKRGKGRPAQTAQIRSCRPRPQDPTLPQTRQTERRRQRAQRRKQERKPIHGKRSQHCPIRGNAASAVPLTGNIIGNNATRRQALRPPAARLSFLPSGKEAPAPEPAPRQFQHQRCHELVRRQTRHRRYPQARQQRRPGHRPYQQAQRL